MLSPAPSDRAGVVGQVPVVARCSGDVVRGRGRLQHQNGIGGKRPTGVVGDRDLGGVDAVFRVGVSGLDAEPAPAFGEDVARCVWRAVPQSKIAAEVLWIGVAVAASKGGDHCC